MMNLVKTTLTIAFLFASLHSVAISQLLQWTQANGPYNGTTFNNFTANRDTLIIANGLGYVYRSSDFGNNWIAANSGVKIVDSGRLLQMIVHNSAVFAATDNGVFRSFDNGSTWQRVNNGLTYKSPINSTFISSVSNLFSSGDVIFAGTVGGGLFRSNNLGETWVSANAGLNFRFIKAMGKFKSTLYVSTDLGVYSSEDNGASWKPSRLSLSESISYFCEIGDTFFAGAGNFGVFYRTTNNGESWSKIDVFVTRWLVNINGKLLGGAIVNPRNGTFGLIQSLDKGITWKQIPTNLPSNIITLLTENNGYVFAFTSEGIYRSSDEGNSWTIANKGINFNTINAFLYKDKILYSGTANGIYRSTDLGINWTLLNSGLKDFAVKTITADGNTLYLGTLGSGVYRSMDNGENWTQINKGLPNVAANTIYVSTGGTLFVGTQGSGIYRSVDKGENWLPMNEGLSGLFVQSFIEKDDLLFAATEQGTYVANKDRRVWYDKSDGFPPGLNVGVNTFCITNGIIYAATAYGMYQSTDNGNRWVNTDANTNVFRSGCQSVFVYKGRIFTGCNAVIHSSLDSGKTWSLLYNKRDPEANSGFPALFVEGDTIVAGSSSFGIFRAGYLKPTGIESFQEAFTNFHVFPNPTTDVMTIRLPRSLLQVITVRIVNSLGQEVRRLEVFPTDGSSQLQLNTQELNNGAYVVQVMMGKDMFTKKFLIAK